MDEHQYDGDRGEGSPWSSEGTSWLPPDASSADATPRAAPIIEPADPAVATQHLIDELTATARAKAAAVAVAEAELVDAVAALRPFEGTYLATWRQWISWQCGLTSGETARLCRLADRLVELPLLDDALRTGRLSAGVADVLAGAATPATEPEILAVAAVATGRQLQQLVRDHRQARRTTTPPTPADDAVDPAAAPSEVSWGWSDDGRHRGSWNLAPDDGATLEAALECALARLRPTESAIDGTASVAEGLEREEEKPRFRRSDALVGLANTFLADEADDGLLAESTQIILHRDVTPATGRVDPSLLARFPDPRLPDLRRPPTPDVAACGRCGHVAPRGAEPDPPDRPDQPEHLRPTTLPGCGTLDPRVADLLGCAALVITVEMIAGFPASVPTASRSFNRSQRRALRARDRHCRFPGCHRTRHLHAHHTKPYGEVHRTSVADGVLLCGQHHRLVHLRGHTITLGVDHTVTVTRADGSVLRGVALPPPSTIDRIGELPADRRLTGTSEPLTSYGRSVIVEHWLGAEPSDDPELGEPPDPPGQR